VGVSLSDFVISSPRLAARYCEKRIARARDWLLEAKPATNVDRAMQLAGLYWAGSMALAPALEKDN
jgi:hypothetical protein